MEFDEEAGSHEGTEARSHEARRWWHWPAWALFSLAIGCVIGAAIVGLIRLVAAAWEMANGK